MNKKLQSIDGFHLQEKIHWQRNWPITWVIFHVDTLCYVSDAVALFTVSKNIFLREAAAL
jgi:hypothetical protein